MSSKKHSHGLGKALIKAQRSSGKQSNVKAQGVGKHVSTRDGGNASNALTSYIEGSSLDDFLATAVLADREFSAIRDRTVLLELGAQPVNASGNRNLETTSPEIPKMSFSELKVPRRPAWDAKMSAEELNLHEREAFLDWRREIARMESTTGSEVTPFEKNLEVWRQLWHVRERSDVLIQIVDARNPLFYRSKDLDNYAYEEHGTLRTLLLVNKSDFLTSEQRSKWLAHFKKENILSIFFSAKLVQDEIDDQIKTDRENVVDPEENIAIKSDTPVPEDPIKILSRLELLDYLHGIAGEILEVVGTRDRDKGLIKFGMVGYPNVGKSSVINSLLGASTHSHKIQRVAVGATPGKTKHFQTLILSDKIMLCDCPGLVFPSFVNSKAEMYCCGVLPISQLRHHVAPCQLMCQRIPKLVFDQTYGIKVPLPSKLSKETDPVDVYLLLETYARYRGYTTTGKGGPDTSRAARDLLRDYVNGKLLYCHPPPEAINEEAFDPHAIASQRFGQQARDENDSQTESDHDVDIMQEGMDCINFDVAVGPKVELSKRLRRHGRKGRKGRDKNPYEQTDDHVGVTVVPMNAGGKKNRRREKFMAIASQ